MEHVLVGLEWVILAYFIVVNSLYFVLLLSASAEMRGHLLRLRGESLWRVLQSDVAPVISMLAPAHNEAATIVQNVRAMLGLYYPNLELVVVSDGSTDSTVEVLVRNFALVPVHPIYRRVVEHAPIRTLYRSRSHPGLLVVDKDNGGKADALNAALNLASGSLVCAIDADTIIEPDALQRMVRPFLTEEGVSAAGGTIRVANGSVVRGGRVTIARAPRSALAGFQVVEYLRAFLFGRLGWNRLGGNLIISGAFGLFDRAQVLDVGGYAHDTVGEDMELVLRLRRHAIDMGKSGRVEFIPDPVAWTEVPETLRGLGRQRDRWHRGLTDALWRNRAVMGRPAYRGMGLIVYPYFVVVELLGPVVEFVGLLGLGVGLLVGAVSVPFAVLFFLAAYGYAMFLTIYTLLLEEVSFHRYVGIREQLVLLTWGLLENLGYRQLTVLWRLRGLVKFLRKRTDWGVMERQGFGDH
jgi:cellulose synthase/poly-beta-1,6-N-acetylglucosamine synthase-like glycosyltransferase